MISQKEIARLANVSQSVVSRVLSNGPKGARVAPDTAARIRDIAKAMGYQPNQAAHVLLGLQSRLIGVVVRSFGDPYLTKILDELSRRAEAKDYTLLVAGLDHGTVSDKTLRMLSNHRPLGLIVVGTTNFEGWNPGLLGNAGTVVQIGQASGSPQVISCGIDEREAARQVAAHLWEMGHRSVGILGDRSAPSQLRLGLLKEELALRGIPVSPPCCHLADSPDAEAGAEAATYFLNATMRPLWPDAVVALGDLSALSFLRGMESAGIRIPHDLSLVSYDDIEAAALSWPSLTTIRQPVRQLAATAIDIVTGEAPRNSMTLPPELIVRESTRKI